MSCKNRARSVIRAQGMDTPGGHSGWVLRVDTLPCMAPALPRSSAGLKDSLGWCCSRAGGCRRPQAVKIAVGWEHDCTCPG